MKVVIDTNVLISGLYFGGVPARVISAWTEGRTLLVVSPEILHEYRRVGLELAKGRPALIEVLDALYPRVWSTRRPRDARVRGSG